MMRMKATAASKHAGAVRAPPRPARARRRRRRRAAAARCRSSRGAGGAGGGGALGDEETLLRAAPIAAGAVGGALVALNKALSGAAPSGASSRADVAALALSAVLIFTGLQLLSLKQPASRRPVRVPPEGVPAERALASLAPAALRELRWLMSTLERRTTVNTMLVYYYRPGAARAGAGAGAVVFHGGVLPAGADGAALDVIGDVDGDGGGERPALGSAVCAEALASMKANYIANLRLSPARVEFSRFIPENTQSLLIQPLGDGQGLMLLGSDTVRGINKRDQSWILTVSEKLDSTLDQLL